MIHKRRATTYELNGRSNLKVRDITRATLPRGIYKYLVIINLASYEIRSKTYNIARSHDRLVKYRSEREKQKVRDLTRNHYKVSNRVWSLDKIIADVEGYAVGKTKIDFKINRNRPLYIYLTHKEDFTILLMNYQNIIFRIYKFSTEGELE